VDEISRRHGDFALVGVTTVVRVNASGACDEARMVFFGVGDGPMLAETAAGVLRGEKPTAEAILAAAEAAAEKDVDPPTDVHATAAYRRHLVKVLAQRTLQQAFDRALGKEVSK
jgi:CO/xanthine dehydrogenase FAD-binding subunit